MPALTVHNAEIKTATVEIRTLTISGKQVTLAVFRQLREERLIDGDGYFVGLPWGTVNYHPSRDCHDAVDHHHVVWQLGTELRRAWVEKPLSSANAKPPYVESGERWVLAAALEGWRPGGPQRDLMRVEFDAGLAEFIVPSSVRRVFWPHAFDPSSRDKALDDLKAQLEGATRAELLAEVDSEIREALAEQERRHARWIEIQALPQLFIAV